MTLRADASRNVEQLRTAALNAFRGHGLNWPLAQIATDAGVSKGTIYNHFGGRHGLIEAVIQELVATELYQAMEKASLDGEPWHQIADWVSFRRDLQYREPAFTDVMLMTYPASGSGQLSELAKASSRTNTCLVKRGHEAMVLRPDLTAGDLFWADVANGLALRELSRPKRGDYDRRTRQFLESLRPHS